jgi:hypothetical protein
MEVLSVHLETMALVLLTTGVETFQACHNHLGGAHFNGTVSNNLDIVALH